MVEFLSKISFSKKTGLPPGTLLPLSKAENEPVTIEVIDYTKDTFNRKKAKNVEETFGFLSSNTLTWVNINGIHDVSVIAKVGKELKIHTLIQEDITNIEQRPKVEEAGSHLFIAARMLRYNQEKRKIESEHISIILGKTYVVSFQEHKGDVFDPIRSRIENNKGKVRTKGPDYLAYILLDIIVDNYFSIIEYLGDDVEKLEDEIFKNPESKQLKRVQQMKKELVHLRKSIYPLREVVIKLEREESPLIKEDTQKYLRDLYDHTIYVIESLESYRDINSGLKDIYLSAVSHQMNQVMQVLTIISTIFIPITFVAGIYGMNFEYMPELSWDYGYFAAWGVMVAITIGMIIYFKRKKWF